MKWKCTTSLLSVPMTAAVIGLGMNALGQDRTPDVQSSAHQETGAVAPDPNVNPAAFDLIPYGRDHRVVDSQPMASALGQLVYDSSGANGTNGLSHFEGVLGASTYDRTIVDDVVVAGGADLVGAQVCGVWFAGSGAPGPVANFRVRIWTDAGNTPTVGAPIHDLTGLGFNAFNTGQVFFGRPEVCYDVKFPNSLISGAKHWVSVQPTGTTDNFFHLTANDAPNLIGEQIHLWYIQDGNKINPQWTPGSVVFGGAQHDVVMRLYASEGELIGACCTKVDGVDGCEDDVDSGDCDGVFHPNATCAEVTCPSQVECKPFKAPDDDCPECTGDLNDDGVVNVSDLLMLFDCWGPVTSPDCECADFNGDNVVNVSDLLIMFDNWGTCPTAIDGGGTTDEGEACGERINDGCNQDPPQFGSITCGETICGTGWTGVELADPPDGHLPGTCEGFCGGQSADGCWCDDQCFGFGDCCIDICEWCSPPDVPECVSGEVNVRDTDWYLLEVDTKTKVTWKVHAEFPASAIIAWMSDCDEIIIIESATSPAKVPFEIEACLQPGKPYILFIAPSVFEGLPCEGEAQWGHNYTVQANCDAPGEGDCPKGACCFADGSCQNLDELKCGVEGGNYQGDGTDCADNPCAVDGACCFNDGECIETAMETCVNDLLGAFRGIGTSCGADTCRDCATQAGVQFNPNDVCDGNIDQDPYNGGCNYYPFENPAWEQACCGDSWIGEIWAVPGVGRDLDWRVLEVKKESSILLTLQHDFNIDGIVFFASAGCPASIISSASGASPVHLQRPQVAPGTYYVIVTSDFATGPGMECGSGNNAYQLDITCKNFDGDLCQGECGNPFIPNDTFPEGFCSCDPDFCGVEGNCCPGICEHCDTGTCDLAVCENADDITANINGPSVLGNNSSAEGEVALPPGSPSCQWQGLPQNVHNTVWYKFVAPANGAVTIETCGSSTPFQDSVLGLYSGTCGSLVEIGCGGDDCPAPDTPPYYSRIIATGLVPGETYYISLSNNGGWGGSTPGDYVLDITSP
jgi:hypothetical protein